MSRPHNTRFALPALRPILALIAVLAAAAASPNVLHADQPPARPPKVERSKEICYWDIADDPDRERHCLDIYRPVGKDDCPVVFFVHGGGWVIGSKEKILGIYGYANIAESLAARGVVVVLPNYRLSPKVKHPEHVKDVARAFAWTHQHAKEYGGRPDQIFACGHSAGGHLVALMATDETYLKAEGLSAKDIKGVVSVSGVYDVEALDIKVDVKRRWFEFHTELRPFACVFGEDAEAAKQASPINHVRKDLPPFLLIYGGMDYPPVRQTTNAFEAALEEKDCDVQTKKIPWRTHETVVVDLAHGMEPKTSDALLDFVKKHTREP
jgi:acetyl esterase/lipase